MRSDRSPVPTCALRSRRARRVQRRPLLLVQPRAQDLHRLGAVLVLALLLLHRHHDAGRQMRDAHRAFGLVDVLPAGAGRAVDVDAQVALVDLDIDLLGLRQHGDGDGGGVDAALAFGRRHALHAMHAGFVFQPGEHAAAGDLGDALLQAAQLGVVVFQDLEPPAARLRRISGTSPNSSAANSAASSPPAAGRTSRMAARSSASSFGSSARRISCSSAGIRSFRSRSSALGQLAHLRIGQQRLGFGLGALGGAQLADARRPAVRSRRVPSTRCT